MPMPPESGPPYTPPPPALAGRLSLDDQNIAALHGFAALLSEWTARINLIARSQLPQLWMRHIWDSAQALPYLPPRSDAALADLGSGGGFPGLVLAILDRRPTYLIEADTRKSVFLREAARRLNLSWVTVLNRRIEEVTPAMLNREVAVITARALAPLSELLGYAYPLLGQNGQCVFWKGENYEEELTLATKQWNMTVTPLPSLTGSRGVLLNIGHLHRETP